MRSDLFKIILCFGMMLALPGLSFADKAADGNTLYAKGQYKEAAAAYQSVVDDGNRSAIIYYNLGNAYFELGNVPSALLYYEKAHLLAPGDEDINFNIRFANTKTTDRIDEVPEFFVTKWWNGFILSFSSGALAVGSILLFLVASGALVVYFFAHAVGIKKTFFFSAIALYIVGIFVVIIAFSQASYFTNHKQAIIFSNSVNIKSGPADKQATLFVLHGGTKINIQQTNNDWVRFKLANGNEGWIKATDIKEI